VNKIKKDKENANRIVIFSFYMLTNLRNEFDGMPILKSLKNSSENKKMYAFAL
jgi:hypothetical protein